MARSHALLAACAVLVAVAMMAAVPQASAMLLGVTYAPYTAASTYCETMDQVKAHAAIAFKNAPRIRTYAIACPNSTDVLLEAAQKKGAGYQIFVGVRLGDTQAKIDAEFVKLQALLDRWGPMKPSPIYSLGVGNEYLSSGGSLDTLLKSLDRAKAMAKPYGVQVTTAELPEVWTGKSVSVSAMVPTVSTAASTYYTSCLTRLPKSVCAILARVDWVGIQAHPYFRSLPVDCSTLNIPGCYDAAHWVVNASYQVKAITQKWIRVTEVGWPTAGEKCCQKNANGFPRNATLLAVPSTVNAGKFLASLEARAKAASLVVFHFQLLDADWKRVYFKCICTTSLSTKLESCPVGSECQYEYNWGLLKSDGTKKTNIPMLV